MIEVKIVEDVRSDRHYVTAAVARLADLTAMADAVAASAGCLVTEVEFTGAFGYVKVEARRSLTREEYLERSSF